MVSKDESTSQPPRQRPYGAGTVRHGSNGSQAMGWDVEKAVRHLQANAESGSLGKCARYTREAIEAGGGTLTRHISAKNYGSSLTAVGFVALTFTPKDGYAKGDVAVIQGFDGHPHGHMQMYDGTRWISDFKQRDFWPGGSYRRKKPAYVVYR